MTGMSDSKAVRRKKGAETRAVSWVWGAWNGRQAAVAMGLLAVLAVASVLFYVLPLTKSAGAAGFPSDEPWIALTFAKNLVQHGVYAPHPSLPSFSGSTSPLMVLLLALLGLLVSSPTTAAYIVGAASYAAAAVFLFRLARKMFPGEDWIAFAAGLLFVLYPRMQAAAASGHATMLFIALAIGAWALYAERKPLWFFTLAGLALWVRPDALVLLIAALFHLFYHHRVVTERPAADATDPQVTRLASRRGMFVWFALFLVYLVFNLALNGTIFPNSVGSKLAYFHNADGGSFASGVLTYFTSAEGAVLILAAVLGIALLMRDFLKRKRIPVLSPAVFAAGLIIAYGIFLPVLRDDARYLAPAVPAFILLALWGARRLFGLLVEQLGTDAPLRLARPVLMLLAIAALALGLAGTVPSRESYVKAVRYVNERQIAAAHWLAQNTNPDALIATQSAGVIGYFSGRKVVDVTGVLTPELVSSIGDLGKLETYLAAVGITHYAMLREQYEVVNVNPLFTSDIRVPEVMEVLPFKKKRSHIMPQAASALNVRAATMMASRLNEQALAVLEESYKLDPASARTQTLIGLCLLSIGDSTRAINALERALRLQEDYGAAMLPLGDMYSAKREHTAAIRLLGQAVLLSPNSTRTREAFEKAALSHYRDSLAALGFRSIMLRGRR